MAKLKGVAAKAKKKVQVLTEGKDVKLTHIYDPESLTSWRNVLVIEGAPSWKMVPSCCLRYVLISSS